MIRFVLKYPDEKSMKVKTVDVIVPEIERDMVDTHRGGMIVIGMEQMPCCDICFRPDCTSDHK